VGKGEGRFMSEVNMKAFNLETEIIGLNLQIEDINVRIEKDNVRVRTLMGPLDIKEANYIAKIKTFEAKLSEIKAKKDLLYNKQTIMHDTVHKLRKKISEKEQEIERLSKL
jgi:ABC-type phosphate transport system ATPase subunit